MVVIECKHEPQLVDPRVVRGAQLDDAVGLLPRASGASARQGCDEHAVNVGAGRVAPRADGFA